MPIGASPSTIALVVDTLFYQLFLLQSTVCIWKKRTCSRQRFEADVFGIGESQSTSIFLLEPVRDGRYAAQSSSHSNNKTCFDLPHEVINMPKTFFLDICGMPEILDREHQSQDRVINGHSMLLNKCCETPHPPSCSF